MQLALIVVWIGSAILLIASHFVDADVKDGFRGYKVYRLTIQSQRQLDLINRISEDVDQKGLTDEVDVWTELPRVFSPQRRNSFTALILLSPEKQAAFLETFDSESISHEVTIPDLAVAIEEESRFSLEDTRAVENGGMTWTAYHRYSTMVSWMDSLRSRYPDLVNEKVMIGKTYEGRNMYLLKVGKPRADGKMKPGIYMDANIHAREWIAGATLTFMVNKMVTEYETNSTARRMMNEIDWYIVPSANPDGYEYSHAAPNNRLWRKTRRVNPFSTDTGCDANRNFDFKWMVAGAVQTPRENTYAGAFPYSEIENVHVTEALLALVPQVKGMLSFHSAAQMWLLPWAYGYERSEDYDELMRVGRAATDALTAVYGIPYEVGTAPDILYRAAGGTLDWAKAKAGAKYSYTPELRDLGFGFVLPPNQIIPSGLETFEAVNVIAQAIFEEFGPTLN
ncbi:Carboxypeptidase B [Hypsibius exemplaris]|uniref:Carboxypeptidase B n=1 Tax=Hypsibius exemplaris TaxID=2072580 RepID=A0A1W0WSL1_HYPEX|nr:Carboxypeptidase B [Hypsibius exemplaris]